MCLLEKALCKHELRCCWLARPMLNKLATQGMNKFQGAPHCLAHDVSPLSYHHLQADGEEEAQRGYLTCERTHS